MGLHNGISMSIPSDLLRRTFVLTLDDTERLDLIWYLSGECSDYLMI